MANISDLKFDDRNFNKHTEKGMELLKKSLSKFGAGRSILIDKHGNIIAGNGIVEAAGNIGLEDVEVVKSDGKKIIAVQRTDIELDSGAGREMALADNATAAADLEWGVDAIKEQSKKWGFDEKAWDVDLEWHKNQTEYQDFVDKFKPKLTTDDCYTPPEVFEAVEKWARKTYGLGDAENIRPFKPNGDYKAENYDGKIVIDNPPFSILAEIVRFYTEKNIKFFLFGPQLTILGTAREINFTRVIADVDVVYENGANVRTSFVTNMDAPNVVVRVAGSLKNVAESAQQPKDVNENERYKRPKNVQMAMDLVYGAKNGNDFTITQDECELVRNLDGLKEIKKGLYGGGLLVSDKVAERAAAERAAAERAVIEVELSEREQSIVDRLNDGNEEGREKGRLRYDQKRR